MFLSNTPQCILFYIHYSIQLVNSGLPPGNDKVHRALSYEENFDEFFFYPQSEKKENCGISADPQKSGSPVNLNLKYVEMC